MVWRFTAHACRLGMPLATEANAAWLAEPDRSILQYPTCKQLQGDLVGCTQSVWRPGRFNVSSEGKEGHMQQTRGKISCIQRERLRNLCTLMMDSHALPLLRNVSRAPEGFVTSSGDCSGGKPRKHVVKQVSSFWRFLYDFVATLGRVWTIV